eukprot:scaffold86297_cov51-Phaeocystis_antarctica.AAC.1
MWLQGPPRARVKSAKSGRPLTSATPPWCMCVNAGRRTARFGTRTRGAARRVGVGRASQSLCNHNFNMYWTIRFK